MAILAAEYADWPNEPNRPDADDVFTMRPYRAHDRLARPLVSVLAAHAGGPEVVDDDGRAPRRQQPRVGPPEATSGPGHDGDLTVEAQLVHGASVPRPAGTSSAAAPAVL